MEGLIVRNASKRIRLLTACSSDDDALDDMQSTHNAKRAMKCQSDRTVLVYLAGHNNLSGDIEKNVSQIKEGSKHIHQLQWHAAVGW